LLVAQGLAKAVVVHASVLHGGIIKEVQATDQPPVVTVGDETRNVLKGASRVLTPQQAKAKGPKLAGGLPLDLDEAVAGLGVKADQLDCIGRDALLRSVVIAQEAGQSGGQGSRSGKAG
jgi:hypothetical protein